MRLKPGTDPTSLVAEDLMSWEVNTEETKPQTVALPSVGNE